MEYLFTFISIVLLVGGWLLALWAGSDSPWGVVSILPLSIACLFLAKASVIEYKRKNREQLKLKEVE